MADFNDTTCTSSSDSESECSDGSLPDVDILDEDEGTIPQDDNGRQMEGFCAEGMAILPYQFEPECEDYPSDGEGDRTCELHGDDSSQRERLVNTNWCTCDNCQIMVSLPECVCCQEIARIQEKCQADNPPASCITQHPDFDAVCLNRGVLDTAYYQYRQQYTDVDTGHPNEKYRYVAYRQLVRWCWRYLGKEVRRVLPSCAVTRIRETFPSPNGDYTGFKLR